MRAKSKTVPAPEYPREQLKLFHAELDRQRDVVARRLGNMHTRAAILIGASGVLGTLQASAKVTNWSYVSVSASLLAALLGLWAMRPTKGDDADARKNLEKSLSSHPYSVEHYIVRHSQAGLAVDMAMLDSNRRVLTVGFVVLIVSWGATFVTSVFHSLHWI